MPYIKTTLTDREIHLITSALRSVAPRGAEDTANATLATQVSREYDGLQALLERFVGDFADENPRSTPPARVKPFMAGQPLFQFNVYNSDETRRAVSRRADSDGGTTAFAPVSVSHRSYVGVEERGDFVFSPDSEYPTLGSRRLIGSTRAINSVLADCCDDDWGECQEEDECSSSVEAFFAYGRPKAYTAYLPATSPVLEYINTHRRRCCRDEMLADMSGSMLPLLSREEIREALNINRTELRYAEAPALLVAHKLMFLASIACTAPAEYLSDANIVATIDVLL